jgi:hypothetical protein
LAATLLNIPPVLISRGGAWFSFLATAPAFGRALGGVGENCWNFRCEIWSVLDEAETDEECMDTLLVVYAVVRIFF